MKRILIGSYTIQNNQPTKSAGIYFGTFDPDKGTICINGWDSRAVNPSFLSVSSDHRYVTAVNELVTDGALDRYCLQADGSLRWMEKIPIQGSDCCYLEYDKNSRFLTGTNYTDGSIFSYCLEETGNFGPRTAFITHQGSGPDQKRQEHAHAHSMRCFPGTSFMIACDLGADRLFLYEYDQSGVLSPYKPQSYIQTPAGFGPRHMEFSPDARYLYVIGELSSQILVYEYKQGIFENIQLVSTLPEDFSGLSQAADIHLHPDGKWLYASNRGHDSIVQYEVADDGKLTTVGYFSCGGNWPRNFHVCEKHLLCANQFSDNVTVFALDRSGHPAHITDTCTIPAATFVTLV